MRLDLAIPAGWTTSTVNGRPIAFAPDGQVLVAWGSLVARPEDDPTWWREALSVDVPPAARLVITNVTATRTATGYPLTLVTAHVLEEDGRVLEARLGAFYELLELSATALVRAADEGRLSSAWSAALAALTGARPTSAGEILAIANLFANGGR